MKKEVSKHRLMDLWKLKGFEIIDQLDEYNIKYISYYTCPVSELKWDLNTRLYTFNTQVHVSVVSPHGRRMSI